MFTVTVRGDNRSGSWELATGERGTWRDDTRAGEVVTIGGAPSKDAFYAIGRVVQQHVWDRETEMGYGLLGVRPG